jgi:hypothetical protein
MRVISGIKCRVERSRWYSGKCYQHVYYHDNALPGWTCLGLVSRNNNKWQFKIFQGILGTNKEMTGCRSTMNECLKVMIAQVV